MSGEGDCAAGVWATCHALAADSANGCLSLAYCQHVQVYAEGLLLSHLTLVWSSCPHTLSSSTALNAHAGAVLQQHPAPQQNLCHVCCQVVISHVDVCSVGWKPWMLPTRHVPCCPKQQQRYVMLPWSTQDTGQQPGSLCHSVMSVAAVPRQLMGSC